MNFTPDPSKCYFIPLGGVGEIGRNCFLYINRGRFLLIDCGLNFPGSHQPGIDLVLPDIDYVAKNRDRLEGLVITHGHEDHIGAIPYLWDKLRCPIYATPFTSALINRKLVEAGLKKAVSLRGIKPGKSLELDNFSIDFFHITHSIPDAVSLLIHLDAGRILHTGDWKLDPDPLIGKPTDWKSFEKAGKEGVLAMICDSTYADTPGHSGSEREVRQGLIEAIAEHENAVAITLFSSNIARVDSAFNAARELGRDVCLVGRSLETNVQIAVDLGYIKKLPNIIPQEESSRIPKDRILYLCTGCQGEPRAALPRIAARDHRYVRLGQGDAVIFSSSPIPGNELNIMAVQNSLAAQGVHVVTQRFAQVHVSGHPYQEELKKMQEAVRPKYLVPVHGEDQHLSDHIYLTRQWGYSEPFECRNGAVVEITAEGLEKVGQIPLKELGVEESQLVDLDGERMRQRRKMAYGGAATVTVLQRADHSFQMPIAISLIGLYDSDAQKQTFLQEIHEEVRTTLSRLPRQNLHDSEFVREEIRVSLRRALKKLTGKKPVLDVQLMQVA